MKNTLFDYLKWRGNLTFQQDAMNEVDCAICCLLSYLPWDKVVPPMESNTAITLKDAIKKYQSIDQPKTYSNASRVEKDERLLQQLLTSSRYQDVLLSNFSNHLDVVEEKQFSAITFSLNEKAHVIAYRGTDDSIVGWKEDFNMSFKETVPAQQEALLYLETRMEQFDGSFYIVGHSKGGNLAVYASTFTNSNNQNRIEQIYNFDGPGFNQELLKKIKQQAKITTFVPQSSIVGMLLEHEEDYQIVHSYQLGLLQHDLYSWEVILNHFTILETVTKSSQFLNQTIKEWLQKLSKEEREMFVDTLYEILLATDVKTTEDLTTNWMKKAKIILNQIHTIDPDSKLLITEILLSLFRIGKKNLPLYLRMRNRNNQDS